MNPTTEELIDALEWWARYIERTAKQHKSPERQLGKADSLINLANHLKENGNFSAFVSLSFCFGREEKK